MHTCIHSFPLQPFLPLPQYNHTQQHTRYAQEIFGNQWIHSFLTSLVSYAIVALAPRKHIATLVSPCSVLCVWTVFFFVFVFIVFFWVKIYMCVCAHIHADARVCVRLCVCAHVYVCVLSSTRGRMGSHSNPITHNVPKTGVCLHHDLHVALPPLPPLRGTYA